MHFHNRLNYINNYCYNYKIIYTKKLSCRD